MLFAYRIATYVALFLFLAASVVQGATPEENTKAREHFQTGRVHYDLKEYEEALKEFKDAYRIVQDPVFLYNIAQCHWKLDRNQEAVAFYKNYLRHAPAAANRAEVEKRIAELDKEPTLTPPAQKPEKPTEPPAPPAAPPPIAPVVTPEPAPSPPPPLLAHSAPVPVVAGAPPAPVLGASGAVEPAAVEDRPFYKKGWFWAAVAAVVAGSVTTVIAMGRRGEVGDCQGLPRCATIGK